MATGKVFNSHGTSTIMIHNQPLLPEHLKVTIIDATDPVAPLPVPTDEILIVSEAKNTFVQWPKNLIFLDKVNFAYFYYIKYFSHIILFIHFFKLMLKGQKSPYEPNGRKKSRNVDNHSESSSTMNKSQSRKAQSEELATSKQARKLSTPTMEMMHKLARNMEMTISIDLPKQLGFDGELWVTKEEIFQWLYQEEIQATHISAYVG